MGSSQYQLFAVPLKRRETAKCQELEKEDLANHSFHALMKSNKFFDKFLDAWASYIDGTSDDAANMVLYYMAKRYPTIYVKNFDMATKKNDKLDGKKGPPPVELPPDFVSYDGTKDIKWNKRYGELLKVSHMIFMLQFSLPSSFSHPQLSPSSHNNNKYSTRKSMAIAKSA